MWITYSQTAFAMAWLAIAFVCCVLISYFEWRLKRGDENAIHSAHTQAAPRPHSMDGAARYAGNPRH